MSDAGFPVVETTIGDIHRGYRNGRVTCRQLVQAYIDRIEAYDRRGPALNAVVTVNSNALADAAALDARAARSTTLSGPLHGIPVIVKDQIETQGIPTSFGSIAIDGYVPTEDASAIGKLKAAGAIILGKSALPDFATSWFGFSSKSGETKNPYALDRDPGGSSSGTGAAVAANLATVGVGEDTGGSIRLPASFNNLVGVRVTPGLISRAGMSPLVVFQDTAGPMTRTVTDAAILLDAMVGFDPRDEYTAAYAIAGHKGSYAEHLQRAGLEKARVGVLKEAFGNDADAEVGAVNAVIRTAIEAIRHAGAEIVEISLPNLLDYIVDTSLYLTHSRHDINNFLAARASLPFRSLDAIHAAGRYHRVLDLLEEIVKGPAKPQDDPDYYRKLSARDGFQRAVVNLMARHGLDTICFPSVQVPPPTKEDVKGGKWTTLTFPTNTLIAAQTWMPSICLPAGFTGTGLPVGIEFVVLPYHEPDLFRFGYGFEQATRHRRAPACAPEM
jgi:amidase